MVWGTATITLPRQQPLPHVRKCKKYLGSNTPSVEQVNTVAQYFNSKLHERANAEKNPHEIATANIATAMHMENTDQLFSHNDSISQAKQA